LEINYASKLPSTTFSNNVQQQQSFFNGKLMEGASALILVRSSPSGKVASREYLSNNGAM